MICGVDTIKSAIYDRLVRGRALRFSDSLPAAYFARTASMSARSPEAWLSRRAPPESCSGRTTSGATARRDDPTSGPPS
jgi:hypothetical protein